MRRVIFAATITVLSLAGCNGTSTTGDAGPMDTGSTDSNGGSDGMDTNGSIDAMTACTELATARCGKIDACSNGTGVTRQYGSMSVCITRQTDACVGALMAPMTASTPAVEHACASAITAESCADFRNAVVPTECIPPPGPVTNGMPCVTNGQCQSTVCLVPRDGQCGVCATQPSPGDDCSMNTNCGRSLVCNHNATAGTYVCRAPVTAGGTCDEDHPCGADLGCVKTSTTATSGTCQALGTAVGAACTAGNIGMPTCDANQGLFCNASNQCAMAGTASSGQPCGPMMMRANDVFCTGGATCAPASMGATRTCVGPAMDGAACDTTTGPDCLAPARCVLDSIGADAGTSGTCRLFDPTACH